MGISILRHNGVLIQQSPPLQKISIWVKEECYELDQQLQQMVLAWARKIGTPYVEDPVFRRNFFKDFQKKLGVKGRLTYRDFDLHEATNIVEKERQLKALMTKEERKLLGESRKIIRLANKDNFGYALVENERVEIANYIAEPSSIFMGRGKHPLRGRWKQGPSQKDITLNLDPKASMPDGNWKGRMWCPDSLWIAKWQDKLSKKTKYVWIADSASVKQDREREKFDKAQLLNSRIRKVRHYISSHLADPELRVRKIATVCFLIDKLSLRVGDEKDDDEADTVGATTLRPEHIIFHADNQVEFSFLGKDSVPWNKKMKLPEVVVQNLNEFIVASDTPKSRQSAIFKGITSSNVSSYLDNILPGLSAKVFRTYHASHIVKEYLTTHPLEKSNPDHKKKKVATLANLEAAIVCNHMKQIPKNFNDRIKKQKISVKNYRLKLKNLKIKLAEEKTKIDSALKKAKTPKQKKRIRLRRKKYRIRVKTRLENSNNRFEKARDRLELMKASGRYNLTTSLKNYIDPRIYRDWGEEVDYSWEKFYSSSLRKKFSWLSKNCENTS